MRRATNGHETAPYRVWISIHALLAESDGGFGVGSWPRVIFLSTLSLRRATTMGVTVLGIQHNFYPRSPCGERLPLFGALCGLIIFLSTLSLRRATPGKIRILNDIFYFYPRSPCGERHCNFTQKRHPLTISIHALLAESDSRVTVSYTPATISIHALLAESDRFRSWPIPRNRNFYPRSPCGERRCTSIGRP